MRTVTATGAACVAAVLIAVSPVAAQEAPAPLVPSADASHVLPASPTPPAPSGSAAPAAMDAAAAMPAAPEPAAGGHVESASPAFDPIGADIRARLLSGKPKEEEAADWQALVDLYERRKDDAFWVAPTGYNKRAQALVAELLKAADWGLSPADFVPPAIGNEGGPELKRDVRIEAELGFGLAVLKYVRYARGGRIPMPPKQLSSYIDRFPQYKDPQQLLIELASAGDAAAALRSVHPQHAGFERLRQTYLALVGGARATPEIVIIPDGPRLVPGQKHTQIPLLRKRLAVAAPADADETLYDPTLADAVKRFQSEKGTRADGIVGNSTRAALNNVEQPSPDRLLANMEAWRWMPDDLGRLYVWVNIPEFMVRVVKDGAVIHEERVITGEVSKQTPVFDDAIETIWFHPRWNVPMSIKVRELYPSMARGGGAIQRQGLKVSYNGREINPSGVSWGSVDIRNYEIYQPPGPSNVLGQVKFTFPNKHGVYMHDTTSKGLFNEASRPFSHGCMRVRDPLRLAEVLLREDQGWDRARIDAIVGAAPVETPVEVKTRIPVHVTYFTEAIGDDGKESIFRDVYGHEQRIKLALAGKWSQIDVGPDHLAPVKFQRLPEYEMAGDPISFLFGGFGGPDPGPQGGSTKQAKKGKSQGGSLMDLFGGF